MKDLNRIMFYAFRYSLGRSTYSVTDVCEFITDNIKEFTLNDIKLLIKEITEAENNNNLGMDIDREMWLSLRDTLNSTLNGILND